MEESLKFRLLRVIGSLILKRAIRSARHHWVRLHPRDWIKGRIYEESVRERLGKEDSVLGAVYRNQEVRGILLPLLEISEPDRLEDAIGRLLKSGFREALVRDFLDDHAPRFLLDPKTAGLVDPLIFEDAIDALVEFGFNEPRIRDLLWDYTRKLLQNPRASELEDEIGLLKEKPLNGILQNPEEWQRRSKKPLPGDDLSYVYRRLGESWERQQNWPRALESFSRAVQKSREDKEKAKSFRALGTILLNLGGYEQAIPSLKEAVRLAENFEELESVRIGAEGILAWIAMYQGNLTYAEEIFRKHKSYHFLGRIYYEMGRYEESLRMFKLDGAQNERLRRYIADEAYHHSVGFTSRWMSRVLVRLGENKNAEYYWDASKEKFEHHYAYAHLLSDKGVLGFQSGNVISAVEDFQRAIDIWRPLKYLRGYLENTLCLGRVWFTLGNYRGAMRALEIVREKSKPMGNNRLNCDANGLMAKMRAKLGQERFTRILRETKQSQEDRVF